MEKTGTAIGSYAPDFELPGIDDSVHHLSRYLEKYQAVGVVFICNQCPDVRLYLERLKQIQSYFQEQNVTLIGINPNDATQDFEESFENMKAFASEQKLNFPYLRDPTQDVARSFGAETTPSVFLLDREGVLRYSGSIDDNAREPEAVREHYLRAALVELLNGSIVTLTKTQAVGCSIKWRN